MKALFRFSASIPGRVIRITSGLLLYTSATLLIHGFWAWPLALLSIVMVFAGIADLCLLAPLFGLPVFGERLRAAQ